MTENTQSNLINILFDLQEIEENKVIKYKQENSLFNGFDYSYITKKNDYYLFSIPFVFKGYEVKLNFFNTLKREFIYECSYFKLIKSKYKEDNEKFNVLTLAIKKDINFNNLLFVVNDFLNIDSRKEILDIESFKFLRVIAGWIKILRNDEDVLIPKMISELLFLKELFKVDKKVRLIEEDDTRCIGYRNDNFDVVKTYLPYLEFELKTNKNNSLYIKLELSKDGVSINDLVKDLVSDGYDKEELEKVISDFIGNEFIDGLGRNIPYKVI